MKVNIYVSFKLKILQLKFNLKNVSINKIKEFWEKNPLYYGEVNFELGTIEYFENIKKIFVYDLFPGEVDKRILPKDISNKRLLDLGTGPGLYTRFFYENGCRDLYSADLTEASCDLVKTLKRGKLGSTLSPTRKILL